MSGRLDVVGIGSMVVDRLHRAPRILGGDEKGILRDAVGQGAARAPVSRAVGGVVLNHLGWAAALGLRAGIFGRQADDENGRFLRAAMDAAGIARDIAVDASASSFAEIFVDDAGDRAIYMAPGATSETTPEDVRAHRAFIARAAVLTTEVSQLPLDAAREALALAKQEGLLTVVDLDVPPSDALASGLGEAAALEEVLRAADWLKPSKSAARELAPQAGDDALALARALRERFGNAVVVVTDGAAGSAVASGEFEGFVPTRAVKAVDTTGAGDAFLGGLLAGRHHGLALEDAVRLGNACGAACAETLGAFPADANTARARVLELYAGPPFELPEAGAAPHEADALASLRETFDATVDGLAALRDRLAPERYAAAIALVRESLAAGGRVHVTGVGKPEHLAHYAASLLSSTGTPATFLHATEATHGSVGQLVAGDVLVAISNSGETRELRAAVEAARGLGARILGVTGGADSWLAGASDVWLDAGVAEEGGGLGFAPRASAAAELLVLAALSAGLERARGLTREEYHARHPAGALGRKSGKEPA
ncbi:MAG: PfkB family carbohydrate kinase [Myxococcota bacterium]